MEHKSVYVEAGDRGVIQKRLQDRRIDAHIARLGSPESI
jgi:hypothetical protein